jgi:hypothetical protein
MDRPARIVAGEGKDMKDDIIRMAREAGFSAKHTDVYFDRQLERFANIVAAAERKEWPNLDPVITWLENGCDPKEAAKELRIYAAAIRARTP